MEPNRTCTSLDHVYPFTVFDGKPKKGTPCYCGERKWGVEHKPKPKPKPKGVPREENPAHDSDSESTMDPVPTAEGSGELNVEVNSDQQV